MGKLTNGILGPMIGSTGNATAYILNNQNVIRVKTTRNRKFSDKQLENQMRMAVVNNFSRAVLSYLKVGFGIAALGTTKNYHNLATSYNKIHALKGIFPAIELDFTKILVSTGDLLPAQNPAIERINEGLKFSWDVPAIMSRELSDQVMMLAYGAKSGRAQRMVYGPSRREGAAILLLDDNLKKEPLETYISFVSADRTKVANSNYLGRIEPT